MHPIILSQLTPQGEKIQATFFPDKGMNLASLKIGDLEIIDQSTSTQFEERFAGLGALIGPHFHRRRSEILPKIADESLFPHIARVKAKGIADPFSHGIARYAPWKTEHSQTSVKAKLTGKDLWNGIPLSSLEGQNFTMQFNASLLNSGVQIDLSVVSDADSLVGIHYYYHLPKGRGVVSSYVQSDCLTKEGRSAIPSSWINSQHLLTIDLAKEELDLTFFPFPNKREGKIILQTDAYELVTTTMADSQENSWQLYHPKGASFVCIEPISSQDPRHPNLTVSSLKILLEIARK